jgi:hypothetical protein
MAPHRKPQNSWEETYGYTDLDGRFAPGRFQRKKSEIGGYFKNPHHPRQNDFRDFFSTLGVLEGRGDGYVLQSKDGAYEGIYQMDKEHLDYMDFFNTYGKAIGVSNMDDFLRNPIAQEAAGLLSFMGTPGGKDSRFRATAKAVNDPDFKRLAEGGGTTCKVTFVDSNNKGWERTVEIKINYASVSAAAHLVGEGAMAKNLTKIIAGYKSGTPAKIDINDAAVHDHNNVLFTAYMQLAQDYDISGLVNAKPSQSFDPYLTTLLEGRKEDITHFLGRTGSYNRVIDGADLDAAKRVFRTPNPSYPGPNTIYRTPAGSHFPSPPANRQAPTGMSPYGPQFRTSPAAPHQVPSATNPVKASSYPYPAERPNAFGPTGPFTWSQNVSPIGPTWMSDNALLRSLPAWANMPASYPGGVQQPGSGTPAYPSPDPAAPLRRNQFFEPMPLDDPFVTGAAGQEGQLDPRLKNLLSSWPGVYR